MKKSYLLFNLFSILSLSVCSQPTLNFNSVPEVGDMFTYYTLNSAQSSVLPGSAGSEVIWDFSSLDVSNASQFTINYSDPADTPYGYNFPNSNLARVYSLSQTEYYHKNNDSISYLGQYLVPTNMVYHDGQINIKFPSSIGDTFSDYFASNFIHENGYAISRTGTVDVTVDGYGTLILPDRTIPNTIRIKTVKETIDVSDVTKIYIDTTYRWYSPNISDFVLRYYVTIFQGATYSSANLMHSNYIASINSENTVTTENIKLYPNPAKKSVNIDLNSPHTNYSVKIYTFEGQLVKSIDLSTELSSIDVSNFSKGLYLMEIIGPENVITKKFMVD